MKLYSPQLKGYLWKIGIGIIILPIVLFLLLALCIYIPPIQRYVVEQFAQSAEKATGVKFKIGHVGLSFPLDLSAEKVIAVDKGDTLLNAKTLTLDVKLLPLLKGNINVKGIDLFVSKIDSRHYLSNTHIKGKVGHLKVDASYVGIKQQKIKVQNASLSDADLAIALADSSLKDTISPPSHWDISVKQVTLKNVKAKLSLAPSLPQGQQSYSPQAIWLAGDFQEAKVTKGHFDIGRNDFRVASVHIRQGALAYTPLGKGGIWTKRVKANHIPKGKRIDSLNLVRAEYTYQDQIEALIAWRPQWRKATTASSKKASLAIKAFNPQRIAIAQLHLDVDSLHYDSIGQLRLNMQKIAFVESSGFRLSQLSGTFFMDSTAIQLPKVQITLPQSQLQAKIHTTFEALKSKSNKGLNVQLKGQLGLNDFKAFVQGSIDKKLLAALPNTPIQTQAHVNGSLATLNILQVKLKWAPYLNISLAGKIKQVTNHPKIQFNYIVNGQQQLPKLIHRIVPKLSANITLPSKWKAKGLFSFHQSTLQITSKLLADKGSANIKGRLGLNNEAYDINLQAQQFPLHLFLKDMGLSPFSGKLHTEGKLFDILSGKATSRLEANIEHFFFEKYNLSGIELKGKILQHTADIDLKSNNPLLDGVIGIHAQIGKRIVGTLEGNLTQIDFHKIGIAKDSLAGGGAFAFDFSTDKNFKTFSVNGKLKNMYFLARQLGFTTDDIYLSAATTSDTTQSYLRSGDLVFQFGAKGNLYQLLPKVTRLSKILEKQIETRSINQKVLKKELPTMNLQIDASRTNALSNFLRIMGYDFKDIHVHLAASPQQGLNGKLQTDSLFTGTVLIDHIHLQLTQRDSILVMNGQVKNDQRYNPNRFRLDMDGEIFSNMGKMRFQFYDKKGNKGVDLGAKAQWLLDGLQLSLYPENPILAYRNFTINTDNYIFLGNKKQIRANIDLLADDGTGLKLFSIPNDSVNDLTLSLKNVNLGELASISPSIPQMGGLLSGSIHFYDDHKHLSCMGDMNISRFAYQDAPIGDLGVSLIYLPKENGEHVANVLVSSNNQEILTADGSYSDKTKAIDIKGELISFPLTMVNGFLSGTDVALSGKGKGNFVVTGTPSSPVLNGRLQTDSASVYSDVYGFNLKLPSQPIFIKDSHLLFDNFKLYSSGEEPLVVDGEVNLRDFSNIGINFNIDAHNFELINTRKNRKSMVFGKMFVDYTGSLHGTVNNLSIRGQLDILDQTNMTYILKDSPLTIQNRLDDLVEFVSFADSTISVEKPSPSSSFDMALGINISDAARFHCFLSEDGSNYTDLNGGGNLTFRITQQGDMRLSGRITAQSGEMKYELPIIPLRTFSITPGSYVEFTGNPTNPTLNISATERMKVIINENEQQRPVNFKVGVKITQPLDKMGLQFTIEAPEDLAMQNQLTSMSPEERNKVAVGMMATGMFITDSNQKSNGFKANNALNAFLQSEIQNIAGKALKSVDISLGIEAGTSVKGTQTTDYSFRFAKRFWNDRVNVIIGGRVSAGVEADNRAESIINNISLEYRINKNANRFLRIFYDRNQQDPLEGLLINTGVGYSVRRKTNTFGDLFIFWRKPSDERKKNKNKTSK